MRVGQIFVSPDISKFYCQKLMLMKPKDCGNQIRNKDEVKMCFTFASGANPMKEMLS